MKGRKREKNAEINDPRFRDQESGEKSRSERSKCRAIGKFCQHVEADDYLTVQYMYDGYSAGDGHRQGRS